MLEDKKNIEKVVNAGLSSILENLGNVKPYNHEIGQNILSNLYKKLNLQPPKVKILTMKSRKLLSKEVLGNNLHASFFEKFILELPDDIKTRYLTSLDNLINDLFNFYGNTYTLTELGSFVFGISSFANIIKYEILNTLKCEKLKYISNDKNNMFEEFLALKDFFAMTGPSWFTKSEVLLFERPEICSIKLIKNPDNTQTVVMHKDGSPAIKFRDGNRMWFLNGVRVPQWLSEIPANEIDAKTITSIDNAEVRREFVRKIGIEKVCSDLNSIVLEKSSDGQYELLQLSFDNIKRIYLKMINPSIGIFHIEGVHPDCKTIAQALEFRNGTSETPSVLT